MNGSANWLNKNDDNGVTGATSIFSDNVLWLPPKNQMK
jgi:hypothetical protein